MNKLITKIIGVCLGMSMAAGVGIGVAVGSSRDIKPANAVTRTVTYSAADIVSSSYKAYSNDNVVITSGGGNSYIGTSSNATAFGNCNLSSYSKYAVSPVTTSDTAVGFVSKQNISNVTSINFTSTGGTNGDKGTIYAIYSSNDSTFSQLTITSGTSQGTKIANSTNATFNFSSCSGYFGIIIKCSLTSAGNWKYAASLTITYEEATTDPEISADSSAIVKKGGSTTLAVSYVNFTSGTPITASSDNTSVATITASTATSGTSGTVDLTITGVSVGSATMTISSSGATSITCNVSVYEEKEFTKITMSSQLVDGGHYLIAKTGTSTIMSNTQNSNNRGITTATPAGPSDFSTLTTENADAAVLTFTADGDYFTMYDPDNSGYLCYESGGNYLRTGTAMTDGYYWSISFTDDHAIIENKGYSSYHIRNNGNIMACYTTTQTHVDLYLLTSELPSEKTISSFTMPSESISFENLESYTFTAQYSPSDASETVTASIQTGNVGSVTFGTVNMSNGTLTVVLTGEAAGSLTIVLTGDDSGTTASKSIYINNSERIYNSGKLGTSAISTDIGGSHTTNGVTWYTNDATMQDSEKEFTVNGNTNGVGLGTAAAPVDTFELTSDLFVGTDYANRKSHIISSIIVSSSVAKDGSATLSVYLDGTQIGSTQNLTETLTSYTFTPSSVFAGHITIAIDNDAAKAVNLGSIIVKGVYSGDDESELYYSMAKQLEAIDSCSISESDWNTFLATEDDIELGMTYGEIFEASRSDFEAITLWDHESKDSSSLKTSSFSAFEKYDYIQSRFNGESGLRGLLNKVNTNSTTIIIVIISVLSLASLGAFFLLRKKKEVK